MKIESRPNAHITITRTMPDGAENEGSGDGDAGDDGNSRNDAAGAGQFRQ